MVTSKDFERNAELSFKGKRMAALVSRRCWFQSMISIRLMHWSALVLCFWFKVNSSIVAILLQDKALGPHCHPKHRTHAHTHTPTFRYQQKHMPWQRRCTVQQTCPITVEPLNKGHFGTCHSVLRWEAVLFSEVKNEILIYESGVSFVGRLSVSRKVLYWRFDIHIFPGKLQEIQA